MGSADKVLTRMRENPRDWRIDDLENVSRRRGFSIRKAPGSHVTFSTVGCQTVVTVPAHKPVKPVYVRMFLRLADEAEEV